MEKMLSQWPGQVWNITKYRYTWPRMSHWSVIAMNIDPDFFIIGKTLAFSLQAKFGGWFNGCLRRSCATFCFSRFNKISEQLVISLYQKICWFIEWSILGFRNQEMIWNHTFQAYHVFSIHQYLGIFPLNISYKSQYVLFGRMLN